MGASGGHQSPGGRIGAGWVGDAVTTLFAVGGLAIAGLGTWQWLADGGRDPLAALVGTSAATASVHDWRRDGDGDAARPPVPEPAASPRGAPERIVVPALGVDAPVDAVAAPEGTLTPPADAGRLGWWAGGARPGDGGSVLVAGHTVGSGGGALDDLEDLGRGDVVTVRTATGRTTYVVDRVQVLDKHEVARRSARLFGQDGAERLVLVTCEDWDGSAFRSNVVVTATPRA